MTLIDRLPATSSQKTQVFNSTLRNLDVEQWAILLAAEDVCVAGTAARQPAEHREFDRQCRVESDVVGELRLLDAENPAHGCTRQDPTFAHPVISCAVGKDNVEGDLVDPGVLVLRIVLAISDNLRLAITPPPASHHLAIARTARKGPAIGDGSRPSGCTSDLGPACAGRASGAASYPRLGDEGRKQCERIVDPHRAVQGPAIGRTRRHHFVEQKGDAASSALNLR